jgi:cathepsin B
VDGGLYGDTSTCKPYSFPPCAHHVPPTSKYPACPSSDYPTPKCTKECDNKADYTASKSFAAKVYTVTGEGSMMTEISTNGPIEAAFTVYEDFVTYKSGVYKHTTGRELGGHAIRILGYGTENGENYWLVANSWNE